MKFIKPMILTLCLLLLSQPLLAGPEIQTWETRNGAQVLFVAAPDLPMLDVRVVFRAGSAWSAKPGVASLTNSMMDQGAGDWSADQIAERMAEVGSNLGNGSLRDMAWVSVRTLTRQPALDVSLETLAAVVGKPSFPQGDFERLRRATLVALNQDKQQPKNIGKKLMYRQVYGKHPYAVDPLGDVASVEAFSRDDLLDHYRRHYVARNAVVAMVGALSREQAEQVAEQVTSGLQAGEPAPALPQVSDLSAAVSQHVDFPASQTALYVAQPGIKRGDEDYFPLYVGNHILGGNGLVSILSNEVREKRGLTYSVYSYFLPMLSRGPFLMGLQTKGEQTEEALAVLMQTLNDFRDKGPSEEQLQASKQNITGGFPLRIATNAKIVEYLAVIGFYKLPLDYLDTFNAKVEAVTVDKIRDAFQRRVDPKRLVTVTVGKTGLEKLAAKSGE